ncbi:MAG: glycoside hydrolase family 31 protein [Candidatus Methylacidiphilales bacterium]|nr:glycoside hydrolase family 31 protein [Candidatus Methylacidiphilales bacterium]
MKPKTATPFQTRDSSLFWSRKGESLLIEPWGRNSVRIRATRNASFSGNNWALLPQKNTSSAAPIIRIDANQAAWRHGSIRVVCTAEGQLRLENTRSLDLLLQEHKPRAYRSKSGGLYNLETTFQAFEDERFYGLGQHPHGFLNQKGCSLALEQRNTEINIPFLISSRGYGFLWNQPGVGRVDLGRNGTRWNSHSSPELDLWITVEPSYAGILKNYASATGGSPPFPTYASGFWQCKLRYRNQEELLSVAREHKRRGLPLSVIVVDYFHWTAMGDWKFDPKDWPDPGAMVRELRGLGIELMVSVWPTVNALSENFPALEKDGLLVGTERGLPVVTHFIDTPQEGRAYLHHYDATHPEARKFLWNRIRENYLKSGIRVFWLDACEPELNPFDHDNLRYHLGNGETVGSWYPLAHAQTFYDGLKASGEKEILTLCRSAWAGSQRYGAAVWSGDISSTFDSLQKQIKAGLNMALSGIPWWTTDIGGFHGGDPESPEFRELIVRWFQYGVFCPIFRLHGARLPSSHTAGGPNEVWSFGEKAYQAIRPLLFLREKMRPYIHRHMKRAEKGMPLMRPVFVDHQHDPKAHDVEDAFMFGPDLMIAPVTEAGALQRTVYLPAGTEWQEAWTGQKHPGGRTILVAAPLEIIPVLVKAGSPCAKWFKSKP